MLNIKTSDKWYRRMAELEEDYDISAGGTKFKEEAALANVKSKQVIVRHGRPSKHDALRTDLRWVGYSRFMQMLRIRKKLSFEQLANEIDVDPEQLVFIERKMGYKAPPRTLRSLAHFYGLPMSGFLQLAGVVKMDERLEERMVKFAAESDSFETLSVDEKRLLDNLIKLISERSGGEKKAGGT